MQISLVRLATLFLKIGTTSFGGYTALIAVVQKELVEKQKLLDSNQIIDALALAAMLPGPLAVNCVAYFGYLLRGWSGALISLVAVLLPSVVFMLLIGIYYEEIASFTYFISITNGVLPIVAAIVASVAFSMFQKSVKNSHEKIIFLAAILVSIYFKSIYVLIISMMVAGVSGIVISKPNTFNSVVKPSFTEFRHIIIGITAAAILYIVILSFLTNPNDQLVKTFASLSLSLFGGGYVMIPLLHQTIVTDLNWIDSETFSLAISFGQITPGPILVSATFIGYQINGLVGGVLSTMAIFFPSALLMVILSVFIKFLNQNAHVQSFFRCARPVIVAYILTSVFYILPVQIPFATSLSILFSAFILLTFARISFYYLILIGAVIGITFL